MEEQDMNFVDEVMKIVKDLKPDFALNRGLLDCGCGFAEESIFSFSKDCCLWIVLLCKTGNFACKPVTAQWIETFSNLILKSPRVFVEFDINHKITGWAVAQEKICCIEDSLSKKMVRAV